MNLLYTPVLAAGPLPMGNLLKATSSQKERAHKALRHYITAVRAQLSIAAKRTKAYMDLLYVCSERRLTGKKADCSEMTNK